MTIEHKIFRYDLRDGDNSGVTHTAGKVTSPARLKNSVESSSGFRLVEGHSRRVGMRDKTRSYAAAGLFRSTPRQALKNAEKRRIPCSRDLRLHIATSQNDADQC